MQCLFLPGRFKARILRLRGGNIPTEEEECLSEKSAWLFYFVPMQPNPCRVRSEGSLPKQSHGSARELNDGMGLEQRVFCADSELIGQHFVAAVVWIAYIHSMQEVSCSGGLGKKLLEGSCEPDGISALRRQLLQIRRGLAAIDRLWNVSSVINLERHRPRALSTQ